MSAIHLPTPDADQDGTASLAPEPAESSRRSGAGIERRQHLRRPYPFMQMVAPLFNGKMPGKDDFRPVRCHEISRGGISFLSPTPPPTDTYVIELGSPPRLSYLVAMVVHATRLPGGYLVGCQFVGRAGI